MHGFHIFGIPMNWTFMNDVAVWEQIFVAMLPIRWLVQNSAHAKWQFESKKVMIHQWIYHNFRETPLCHGHQSPGLCHYGPLSSCCNSHSSQTWPWHLHRFKPMNCWSLNLPITWLVTLVHDNPIVHIVPSHVSILILVLHPWFSHYPTIVRPIILIV